MSPNIDSIREALPEISARQEGGKIILSPSTTQEVSCVLAHCNGLKAPLAIAGAGTKRGWAAAVQSGVVLETARIRGVREHPWQDLTATVGAGTTWAEMQSVLFEHRQFVAMDPLWPERASVGGVLATNDSGALRLRYGSARDLVIGMTVVLADGTIAKTGGKVVKNVAGYDLHKLMIGAFGTLAVVTEITFRLHPLPGHRKVWSTSAGSVEPLGRLATAINASHLNAEAVQVRVRADGCDLDVLLSGAPDVLKAKVHILAALATTEGLSPAPTESSLDVFRAREELFTASDKRVVKATLLQTAVPAVLAQFASEGVTAVGYPLGMIYADVGPSERAATMLRRAVQETGGTLTRVGESAAASTLMRTIKYQFDPNGILNRGLVQGF